MVSAAIVVVSIAAVSSPSSTNSRYDSNLIQAAAIAVYESPQARQFAEDVRRKIAVALHSLGDEINPQFRQPRFNRPEDAEGFLQSQGNADVSVDADEESKRRQREELMYWNAVHLEKQAKERKERGDRPANKSRGSSFDDFLKQDETAEKGTFVYNTGADVNGGREEGLRNRGVRGLNRGSAYANPFSDEHNIEADTQLAMDASLMSPEASEKYEVMSDIYTASESPRASRETTATIAQLIDVSDPVPDPPISYPTMELEEPVMAGSTNFTNMAPRDDSPFASIHAWADNTNSSFYSPLLTTPRPATPTHEVRPSSPTFSDPDVSVSGSGEATPTDSASVAGSAEEVWAPRSGATSEGDVMSIDGDGISTPGTWTEVGSVVSENDIGSGEHH